MALSSTAIPHSNFRLADASCYPVQMKLLKGQSRRLQSHLLIHVGRHPNYSTPSVKLPTKAQFCEPSKVKLHVNFIREKMWDMTPDPIKEFPWKKAKDVVLKRALETGQQALKWSLVALLIFGTISDIIFSISKNKELFVPFGLFVGCIMATFLEETSQELFPNLEETGMAWNLMGLSCFFVVVKSLATYFTLGRQIFLLHAANGGLMQILWLSRTSQEDNERGQKQPLVDNVSTTMGVEKLCKQLDGRHRKDVQGTPAGGYTVDSTTSEALDGAVKGVQPLADEVSTAMGVEKLCKQQDGKHEKAVQGTPEGSEYPMDFTDAEALDGAPLADYVSTATGVEKLCMQSDGEQEKDVQRTPEGSMYTMDSMATEALDGAEKVSDIIFDQSVASDNKILIKSNNSSAERMKDPLTHTSDGYRMVSTAAEARVEGCTVRKENLDLATVEALESSSKLEKDGRYVMDSTAAEALDGAGKVSDTTFDQNVANDNKILVGSTADSGAERMNDLLADTVEVLCTDAENALDWAMDSIDAEAFDGEGKVNDNSFDQNVENDNKFLVRSTDGRAERMNDPVADTVEQVDGLSITWRKKKKNVRAGVDIHGEKALDPPDHPLKSHPELLKEELSSLTVSQRKRPRKARVERGTVGKGNLDVTMKALESSQLELKKEPVGGLSIPQRRKKEVRAGECTHGEKKVLNPPDHELHPELPKDGYAMDSMTAEALDGAGKVNGTTKSMNDPLANSVEQVGDLPITQRKKKKQIRSGQGTHREKAAVDPPDHALDSHPELSNEEVANLTISKRKMPKKARIEGGTVGKQNLDLTAEALDSPSKLKREIAHTDAETTLTRRRGRRKNVEKLDGEQKRHIHRTNLKGPANGSSVSTRRKKVRAGESTHGGKAFDPQDHG